jgi:AcrR family transcriptional regulator
VHDFEQSRRGGELSPPWVGHPLAETHVVRSRPCLLELPLDVVDVPPSIEEIAATADVSRRTIYMYFPTLDQLLVDATSGLLGERTIEPLLDSPQLGTDPLQRVDQFAESLLDLAPQALPLARRILKLTVDSQLPPQAARRGYRRVEWLGRVLEPLRGQLDDEQFERLSSALTVVLGWEAMIVLQDTRGLDWTEEERIIRWMARTLVTAILDEGR